jgi:hypothetical protein
MEVSLKEMLIGNQAGEGKHGRWVGKDEQSAQGTPREGIHADDAVDITRGTPSRSRNNGLKAEAHHRGIGRNFRSAIQATTIIPIIAEPTRLIQV